MTNKKRILIVDDTPANISLIHSLLKESYTTSIATNGPKAIEIACSESPPDLILLDIMMPNMDGYEVCTRLKTNASTRDIPIIFLTAKTQIQDEQKGLELGAVDYITKPISPPILITRVNTHLRLKEASDLLKNQNDILEQKVLERTHQLSLTNQALARFVPDEFLKHMNRESILDVQLGDQVEREMTILFSDIRDFTTLSENMTPQENFNFINSYLSRMEPVIIGHQGFIDKYIGDAIMALFPTDADDAIQAGIAMLSTLTEYNHERLEAGYPSIRIGIGINTGLLMLGMVGSQNRMDGTVISNAVNVASRIEGLTKIYGASIVISEQTLSSLKDRTAYNTRFLGKVQVKGKKEPISVLEICDGEPEDIITFKLKTISDFEEGLHLYYVKEFAEAAVCFKQVLKVNPCDKTAQLYLERSAQFMVQGVPGGWNGVETLEHK